MVVIGMVISMISLTYPVLAQEKIHWAFVTPSGPRYQFAAEGMSKEYMKLNPGIDITVHPFPYGEYVTKIALDVAGGTGVYDIIWVDYGFIGGYADANYMMPLDSYISANPEYWQDIQSDIYLNVLNLYQYKEHWYGVPNDGNTHIFYYRKDVLAEKGVEVPETWEQVLQIAPKLHNPPKMYAVGANLNRWFSVDTWLPLFFGSGGWVWDDNFAPTINSPAGVWAGKMLKKLFQYVPQESLSWAEGDLYEGMGGAGITAMAPAAWGGATLTNPKLSKFADRIGATMPPTAKDKRVLPMGGFGLGIATTASYPDKIWDFIMFYTARENQRRVVSYTGQPARISALKDPANVEKSPYFPALAEGLRYALPQPVIAEYAQFKPIIGVQLHKVLLGEKSVEEALDDANESLYEVMRRGGKLIE